MQFETGVHLNDVDEECAACGEEIDGKAAENKDNGDLVHRELLRRGQCPGDA